MIMGRAIVRNWDGDVQGATAKIVHDTNVVIDEVSAFLLGGENACFLLQACFVAKEREVIALECNTYNGEASFCSLIAIKVDAVEVQ